jgi:hypothetical protein
VSGSHHPFLKAGRLATTLLLGSALLLGGCGRDTDGAEKLAEMNAAALRAEKAAERAEAAASKAEKASQPQVIEADPDATEDAEDAAVAAQNEPLSTEPDIKS